MCYDAPTCVFLFIDHPSHSAAGLCEPRHLRSSPFLSRSGSSHSAPPPPLRPEPFDIVIVNGHVMDGTGSPWYSADVGIRAGHIAAIGNLAERTAQTDDRRPWRGRRAGLHRHAGPIGIDDACRTARAVEDLSGNHHRGHRRRQLRSTAQCGDDRSRPRRLRPSAHSARLDNIPRILCPAGTPGNGHQSCQLCGRHQRAAHGARRRRCAAHTGSTGPDAGIGRSRHGGWGRGSLQRAPVCAGALCQDRGADRAGRRGREIRRHLRHAHAQRRRHRARGHRRSGADRTRSAHPGRDLAPQSRGQIQLGPHAADRRPD